MVEAAAVGRRVRRTARGAGHPVLDAAARWGLAARGVIYVLVGLLALRIAFGDDGSGRQADRSGALQEVASRPFGLVLVWLIGLGLAGMALWRLSEAAFGRSGANGGSVGKRLVSLCRCVFYGVGAFSVLSFATGAGSSSSDRTSRDVTARALGLPGGVWLVGAAGVGVAVAGVVIAVRAVQRTFCKHLKTYEMARRVRTGVVACGVAGGVARGMVFGAAGVFAVRAGIEYDPSDAKGMDDTLRSLAETPVGPWLLAVVAVGLALFGVFSCASARWRRV
ncbi:DUF1206 domain-containing protein [Streptomyces sp. NPDC059740]|uniref:DUF1206 domain-containing protein n=1 Tax=Streptomyces sp. NPDC059740 TaxID=3346926 RepID=UPI00365D4F64